MTRATRLLSALLLALAFVQVAEAGPIVYFDITRSLEVNGTRYENHTTGHWSASDPTPGTTRHHSSNIGISTSLPGFYSERITTTGTQLNAFSGEGPINATTEFFTRFALDDPHTVILDALLVARDFGYAEGFFLNETTGVMLAEGAIRDNFRRLQYAGLLDPGVYSYYLFAQINTGLGFHQSHARFGGDLELIAPAPIPEPATMTLLATGLLAAWRARRRCAE
jgi:hypothetical protein